MQCYYTTPWLTHDRLHSTGHLKRAIYWSVRPLLSAYAARALSAELLRTFRPSLVLPGRGMPLETRRRWASGGRSVRQCTILVQGTGTGWDIISWARLRPKRIIATDLYAFPDSWDPIAAYCQDVFGVDVLFRQAALEDHAFLPDASVDLCVSDAVFEHCRDLRSVLRESLRVLSPTGTLYAGYGPLWFAAGGDHFSGRGGLQHAFNHILLSPDEYRGYFQSFLQSNEDFQSGGRYVELDLFSRLRTGEYCRLFEQVGFRIDDLILDVSQSSLKFRSRFPERFAELQRKHAGECTDDDFLIGSNLVRLTK